jgi:flagellar basal body rod protein FlgG
MDGLQREFNIIAHNLANVSTAGYKRRCNTFSKSLIAQGAGTSEQADVEAALETAFDFSQGSSMTETGRKLDFGLQGKGFFVIETPDGPLYTRNGVFQMDQNQQIVDSLGRIVAGEGGPIAIPPDVGVAGMSVSSDGNVTAGGAAVGKFKLVDFGENESKLMPAGMGCFSMPDESVRPAAAADLVVRQGFQESSNVQLVEELVDMIMVTRLYEANTKFIAAKKEVSGSLIGVAMG